MHVTATFLRISVLLQEYLSRFKGAGREEEGEGLHGSNINMQKNKLALNASTNGAVQWG